MCRAQLDGNRSFFPLRRTLATAIAALLIGSCFSAESPVVAAESSVVGQWDSLFGVAFGTAGSPVVVGAKGTLLESHDNGKTWSRRQLGDSVEPRDLYSVRFAPDGKTGWIVGENGTIFRTKDGGRNWAKQQSPVKDSLFKVAVMSTDAACAVGANGILLCTEDGGSTWLVNHFMDFTLFDVAFAPKSGAWAVGDYKTVLFSSDNGKHWHLQSGGKRVFTEPPNFAVAFSPSGDGLLATLGPAIQETRNGGQSWQSFPLTETKQVYAATAVEGTAGSEFWIAGSEGFLSDVGGGKRKSSRVPTGVAADITDISFSGDTGVAVGLGGTIIRLQKADQAWRVSASQMHISSTKQIAGRERREVGNGMKTRMR
jgi:photosystem II stability/assembly factor-like uncharacterized protein